MSALDQFEGINPLTINVNRQKLIDQMAYNIKEATLKNQDIAVTSNSNATLNQGVESHLRNGAISNDYLLPDRRDKIEIFNDLGMSDVSKRTKDVRSHGEDLEEKSFNVTEKQKNTITVVEDHVKKAKTLLDFNDLTHLNLNNFAVRQKTRESPNSSAPRKKSSPARSGSNSNNSCNSNFSNVSHQIHTIIKNKV